MYLSQKHPPITVSFTKKKEKIESVMLKKKKKEGEKRLAIYTVSHLQHNVVTARVLFLVVILKVFMLVYACATGLSKTGTFVDRLLPPGSLVHLHL